MLGLGRGKGRGKSLKLNSPPMFGREKMFTKSVKNENNKLPSGLEQ